VLLNRHIGIFLSELDIMILRFTANDTNQLCYVMLSDVNVSRSNVKSSLNTDYGVTYTTFCHVSVVCVNVCVCMFVCVCSVTATCKNRPLAATVARAVFIYTIHQLLFLVNGGMATRSTGVCSIVRRFDSPNGHLACQELG